MSHALAQLKMSVEMQGALLKVRLHDQSTGYERSNFFAYEKYRREAYALEFGKVVAALPADQVVRDKNGRIVGAELSKAIQDDLAARADRLAADRYERVMNADRGGKRDVIRHFSRASRKRLIEHTSRLSKDAHPLFLTLTYRKNMDDHVEAKKHLDLMLRWLKNHYSETAVIWKLEYQKRGAIHFHLLVFNVDFIPIADLTAHWQKVTGDNSFPDIGHIENRRKSLYYVSKYIAKMSPRLPLDIAANFRLPVAFRLKLQAMAVLTGFIYTAYSEKLSFIGRFWGIFNRKNLPLAPRREVFYSGSCTVYNDLRRLASRRLADRWFLPRGWLKGYTIFVNDALQWLRLLDDLIVGAQLDPFLDVERYEISDGERWVVPSLCPTF